VDPNALVQHVLRESYLQTTADLRYYAEKVKYINQSKKAIREYLQALRCVERKVKAAAHAAYDAAPGTDQWSTYALAGRDRSRQGSRDSPVTRNCVETAPSTASTGRSRAHLVPDADIGSGLRNDRLIESAPFRPPQYGMAVAPLAVIA
jgi:hypothetical protein